MVLPQFCTRCIMPKGVAVAQIVQDKPQTSSYSSSSVHIDHHGGLEQMSLLCADELWILDASSLNIMMKYDKASAFADSNPCIMGTAEHLKSATERIILGLKVADGLLCPSRKDEEAPAIWLGLLASPHSLLLLDCCLLPRRCWLRQR